MVHVAALVPMKHHSERVPEKNFRDFNGRPLFHWILATLQQSKLVDEIIVNTDSDRIANGATEEFDVTIIDRPDELCGDHVSMNQIILHDVATVDADVFLQTHCTNPLLRPETVNDAISEFLESDGDSLFSVTPLQTRLWDTDCEPINHNRDELQRTQDLDPVYEENSNIYLFTKESVERRENRIGNEPVMYPIDEKEATDIDEPVDFEFAEFLHQRVHGNDPEFDAVVEQ